MVRPESLTAPAFRFVPDRQANRNRKFGRCVSAPAHAPETPATVTVDSLDGQEGRRLRPQIFQAVELPQFFGEDVNEYIPEVEHDPAAAGSALDALRTNTGFGHALGDGAIDGAELTLIGTGRNHEVIGKRRELVDVEHDSVASGSVTDDVRQQERSLSPSFRRRGPLGSLDIF